MTWLLSPSGWPVFADTGDEQADLAARGYNVIPADQVQAAIDAFNAGEASPPSTQLPGWALASDVAAALATKANASSLPGKADRVGGVVPDAQLPTRLSDTELRAALVPKWKPNTAYVSGEPVVNPSGQLVTANATFTSGASYVAGNWTITAGGGGGTVASVNTKTGAVVLSAADVGAVATPSGGTDGQALVKSGSSVAWGTVSGGGAALTQKVAVWSDSMGEQIGGDGASLYGLLATALGVETFDGANPGWSSTETAVLQGGLDLFVTLPGNQIPATTGAVVVTVTPTSSFGAATSLIYNGSLAGIPGILLKTGDTNQWKFQRTTAGTAKTISPETRFVSDAWHPHQDWVSIFRAGRNNSPDPGTDAATIVRDIQAMARGLSGANNRYLVLPIYNGSGFATVNTQLAAAFGANYYDLRGWMVRNGLAAAGITPTTADDTAVAAGDLPPSLMYDGTHLTTAGRTVEANRLAELMVAKGWFPSYTPNTVPSAGTPALTNTVAPAITGTATVGSILTVSNGTWSATPDSYSYVWKRAGAAISGATAATYTLVTADAGQAITCTVTAVKSGYTSGSATSGSVTPPALTTITNLATNPRAASNTTGWSSSAGTGGTAALTQLATTGPTADAPSTARMTYSVAPTAVGGSVTHSPAITPSATYHVSAYVRPSWVGATCTLQIGWFNGGTFVGSVTPVVNKAAAQNGWTRVDAAATLPAGVNTLKVIATIGSTSTVPGVGDTWDVTGVLVNGGSDTTTLFAYKDGDSAGWAWNGTAHASTSTGPDA